MATIVITPPKKFAIPKVSELWEAREVLYRFGARDVTLRYRQTLLGVMWVVLQPLLTALIFVLVFSKVAHLNYGGAPPIVFIFVGVSAWNLFSGIITRAQTSLVSNRDLVSKVFFPRMLVPLAVDLLVPGRLRGVDGVPRRPHGHLRGQPGRGRPRSPRCGRSTILLLASGVGLVTAALTVRFRDVNYFVPFFLQFLLFASPIAYAIQNVPSKYRVIYDLNPLTWLLQEFQWSFVRAPAPYPWETVLAIVVPVVAFVGGAIIFEQMERGFADSI